MARPRLAWIFVSACAPGLICLPAAAEARRPGPSDWRVLISNPDRLRLHDWRLAWTDALEQARAAGAGARIESEGALLEPDAAMDGPAPPDGLYRCRLLKIGARAPGGAPFVARGDDRCRVAGGTFAKLDGPQRPTGQLFAYDPARLLFLGTLMLGDETGALDYGRDAERDVVGLMERVGPRRWRLVMPKPRWESLLDVIELTPAG